MNSGRGLQVGDWATTDYEGRSKVKSVQIIGRNMQPSQTGVCFQVTPCLRGCEPDDWLDSLWFEPIPKESK